MRENLAKQRATARRRRLSAQTRRSLVSGLLFVSPWLIGFLAFTLYPAAASFYYSLTRFQLLSSPHWIGAQNYVDLAHDPLFGKALWNTLYLVIFGVPAAVAAALSMALLLNLKGVRGMSIYRTLFYLPVIVPPVASAILWVWLLNPSYGLVNAGLARLGLPQPGWLYDATWSKPAIILMNLWAVGDVAIIYLSGLQDVPQHLYEAAALDGAGPIRRFWTVTVPMLSPVILFNVITALINAFQYFTQAYVASAANVRASSAPPGGVLNSLLFYSVYLYNNAFRYLKMGYASAMAWLLLCLVLALTLLTLRLSRRFVYYAAEGGGA